MATMTQTSGGSLKAFSIAGFKKAFDSSRARQYMSDMEVEQIRTAVSEKNVLLLGKLYEILMQEQLSDEKIVQNFVMTKNRLMDDFTVAAQKIEKKLVEDPQKKFVAHAETEEQNKAEAMLKNALN